MKHTAFEKKHIALGAKMVEFAGYNMPISYSGINDEHQTVRNNAGVFDVSHMSTLAVVKRETGSWKWPLIQLVYMTGLAYALSLLTYQLFK